VFVSIWLGTNYQKTTSNVFFYIIELLFDIYIYIYFSCVNLLVPPDDIQFLRTAHQIYRQHDKYTEAVSLAIRLGDHDLIKEDFEAAGHVDSYVLFILIITRNNKVLIG
jgi:hypothetical protein